MEIISREQAIELGLKRYFAGKPCKWGHMGERDTFSGRCALCAAAKAAAYRAANLRSLKAKKCRLPSRQF